MSMPDDADDGGMEMDGAGSGGGHVGSGRWSAHRSLRRDPGVSFDEIIPPYTCPMFPFDRRFPTPPDLRARMIPASDLPLTGVDE